MTEADTGTHPVLTGAEVKAWRNRLGLSLSECAALLGYSSDRTERLRQRMHEFETNVKPLPAGQTRLLLAMGALVFQGSDIDPLNDLLDHGDFFP